MSKPKIIFFALLFAFASALLGSQVVRAQPPVCTCGPCTITCGGGGAGTPTPAPPSGGPGVPPAGSCPDPLIVPGEITASAVKLAPPYPLVAGQDPTKRGVDVRWTLQIKPASKTVWKSVPDYETECKPLGPGDSPNCTQSNGAAGKFQDVQVGWTCAASTTYYPESASSLKIRASLAASSREWILSGDLQQHYPGAYLHNPDMSFQGGSSRFVNGVWRFQLQRTGILFEDPGVWHLRISGRTSGTQVSEPRDFDLLGGNLNVYLRETTIIK